MNKKEIIEILKKMDCDIAKVSFKFIEEYATTESDLLVYLVDQPSNEDLIIDSKHWYILYINEFEDYDFNIGKKYEFTGVSEFVTDFTNDEDNKINPKEKEPKTIHWYKVKCSLFNHEFGVKKWDDLMEFMKHTIGFDYTITGQYTENYTGVESYYENGTFTNVKI